MKKLFFLAVSALFLTLNSTESFAQTAGCSGTSFSCVGLSQAACTAANGATNPAPCGWDGNGCINTVAGATLTCSAFTTAAQCNALGCIWSGNVTGNADNNAFVNTLCRALQIVTGKGGKAFAAFAIISIGIGFFTGKVSWGLMIGVTAGIAAMFGAPTIVAAIGGGSAADCSANAQ